MIKSREKVALVTGATRNIGFSIARRLAADGIVVALNGRETEAVVRAVDAIRSEGHHAVPAVADVTDAGSVEALADWLIREFGGLDIVVNNAVVRVHGPVEKIEFDDLQLAFDVVIKGTLNCVQASLASMREGNWGRIVNIAGVGGQKGVANHAVTGVTKGGLIGLTKALAHELGPSGITVNAVSPGFIATERKASLGDSTASLKQVERLARRVPVDIPMNRPGSGEDIAATCSFLCRDEAGYITGQIVAVNGGLYI